MLQTDGHPNLNQPPSHTRLYVLFSAISMSRMMFVTTLTILTASHTTIGFHVPANRGIIGVPVACPSVHSSRSHSQLCLFKRLFGDNNKNNADDSSSASDNEENEAQMLVQDNKIKQKSARRPFFLDPRRAFEGENDDDIRENIVSSIIDNNNVLNITPNSENKNEVSTSVNSVNNTKEKLSPKEEAEMLRKQAARTRLEAERMDIELTLQKLASLEKSIAKGSKTQEEKADIQKQIDLLMKKLNTSTSEEVSSGTDPMSQSVSVQSGVINENPYEFKPLTDDELNANIEKLKTTEKFLLEIVAKAAGLDNASDLRALAMKLHEDQYFADVIVMRDNMTEFVPLTSMEIKKLEEGYLKLPEVVREMNERQIGTSNVTEIVMRSFKENFDQKQGNIPNDKLNKAPSWPMLNIDDKSKSVSSTESGGEGSWLFGSKPERKPEDGYIENMLPKPTRREGQTPTEADVQYFIEEILDISTFTVPSKSAEKAPGGFIVRGNPRMEDYDTMIETIDKKLAESSLSEKIQFCFISDPTPVTNEQMETGSGRDPVLYVCGRDLTPTANKLVTTLVSLTGLFFVFSLSCAFFTLNDTVMDRFQADQVAGFPNDLDWLTPLVTPTFISFLAIQFIHEAAHKIYAISNGFDTTLPILVPSPQLGTLGAITPLKSPAKNRKALFDFALVGPIAGIIASIAVLYFGLELTIYADDATYALFPNVPLYFLKQSALGGGVIDSVFGSTLLSAPDINKLIPVHPLVISGLTSLLINGYSLTPFGGTDGGRLILSSFGRAGALFEKVLALIVLVGVSLFTDQSSILVLVPFLVFFQGQLEIPCRNEVDGIDASRGVAAVATAILYLLIVLPDV